MNKIPFKFRDDRTAVMLTKIFRQQSAGLQSAASLEYLKKNK